MIRTLIVDDEKLVRIGLTNTIPWESFDIKIVGDVSNGEKALEFIEENEVDLLITDITMPVMSGLELMRQIRKSYPGIYMVALTCHQDFEYIQECIRLGVIDYIVKAQIDDENFEETIKRIVERIGTDNTEQNNKNVFDLGVLSGTEGEKIHSEDEFIEIRKLWSSLSWMMNPDEFGKAKAWMKSHCMNRSKVKGIFYRAISEWEVLLKTSMPIRWFDMLEAAKCWQDYERWLDEVVVFLKGKVNRSSYSDSIVRIIYSVVSYINENLTDDLSQDDIAKKFSISRGYLSKAFKEIMGVNFMSYVTGLRIDRAKNMLLNSNDPVYRIADSLGFLDEKYFSRLFKESTGLTPVEYRSTKRQPVDL